MAKRKTKKKLELKPEITLSEVASVGLETVGIVKQLDAKVEQLNQEVNKRIDRLVEAIYKSKRIKGI